MQTKFTIEQSDNEIYILRWKEDERLYSYVGEGETAHQSYADVLRRVTALCGPDDNRYSPERVHVILRPGDKRDDHLHSEENTGYVPPGELEIE